MVECERVKPLIEKIRADLDLTSRDVDRAIMLELNQPIHAYDVARLRGGRLVVRRARAGERLVTLDDVERTLTPDMVVIGDGDGVIGLAGVMGGASTEVSPETRDVLLDCELVVRQSCGTQAG